MPARKAWLCRLAGLLFLVVAAWWGLAASVIGSHPGQSFSCNLDRGCRTPVDLVALLPDDEQPAVRHDPAALHRYDAFASRPQIRVGLAAIVLAQEAPVVALFLAVGLALRRLGSRSEQALEHALPWLKRAAAAAVVWAIAEPLAISLRTMLLLPGTPSGPSWYAALDFITAGPALLLAIAAYATAWALEAGIRAERDLADFV